jgi:hypothetical protein
MPSTPYPPPQITGHDGNDPISIKKLLVGDGVLAVQNEILGWIFDSSRQCIEFPKAMVDSLLADLHQTSQKVDVPQKAFEKLRGWLQHACIGIPVGQSLMGPIDNTLTIGRCQIDIGKNPLLKQCLNNFHTIIKIMCKQATFCKEFIPDTPDYVGYCNSSKLGASSIWMSGTKFIYPTVW